MSIFKIDKPYQPHIKNNKEASKYMGTKANRSKLKHLALSSKGHRKLIRTRKKTSLATSYKI